MSPTMTVNSEVPRTATTVLYAGEMELAGAFAGAVANEAVPVVDAVTGPDEVSGAWVEFDGTVAF